MFTAAFLKQVQQREDLDDLVATLTRQSEFLKHLSIVIARLRALEEGL